MNYKITMDSVLALSGVEAIHTATVLEDCVDQLAILGRIMPSTYEGKKNANEVIKLRKIREKCRNLPNFTNSFRESLFINIISVASYEMCSDRFRL